MAWLTELLGGRVPEQRDRAGTDSDDVRVIVAVEVPDDRVLRRDTDGEVADLAHLGGSVPGEQGQRRRGSGQRRDDEVLTAVAVEVGGGGAGWAGAAELD